MTEKRTEDPAPETVRRILDAAAEVFADVGFSGARVDEIARRAGVNKAMLYYHVGDKAALYSAVIVENQQRALTALHRAVEQETTPEGRLRAMIATASRVMTDLPTLPRIILREIAARRSEVPTPVLQGIGQIAHAVGDLVRDGQERGEFRPVEPLLMHFLLVGGIIFLTGSEPIRRQLVAMGKLSPEGARPSTELADAIADLILHGLMACGDFPEAGTSQETPRAQVPSPQDTAPTEKADMKEES